MTNITSLKTKPSVKINTAYCDKFLGNTPRNLIWNNIDYILYTVARKAIATRFDLAQGSHQATCNKKETLQYTVKIIFVFQFRMNSQDCTAKYCESSRCSV